MTVRVPIYDNNRRRSPQPSFGNRLWKRLRTLLLLLLILAGAAVYMTQPLLPVERDETRDGAPGGVDPGRLRRHVAELATKLAPRDCGHAKNLDLAAQYVFDRFADAGLSPSFQGFEADGKSWRNVVASIGPASGAGTDVVVVGAHYDAFGPGIGADDNASGVAGLIELAPRLEAAQGTARIELVAFSLEEPPFFRTRSMGSRVHAASLQKSGVHVRAMVCLEMIGCFRDGDGSQSYPAPGLGLLYPSRGDFIAVVGCLGEASLVRTVKRAMAQATDLPVRSINAPGVVPGVDFSDHLNYWAAGFDAVMVTDTAFFRNENYHRASDTPDTLDYARMAKVVEGVCAAVAALAK
jgi:peptidase M28-like protein